MTTTYTRAEIVTMLNELKNSEYELKEVDRFLSECEEYGIAYNDVAWFLDWEPGMLKSLEYAFGFSLYGAYIEVFPTWEAYIASLDEGEDPYDPIDAVMCYDAGLSGVFYIRAC